jgi:hypothetical protein
MESSPPIEVKIARIAGSAKAAFRSSARRPGSAARRAADARVDGYSRISRPHPRRTLSP